MELRYAHLIGERYEPPFGCFQLVRRFLRDNKIIDVPDLSEGVSEHEKSAAILRHLHQYASPVTAPQPGDIIVVSWGKQAQHIGAMVGVTMMLHSLEGHDAVVERITSAKWRNRIMGFWRVG